MISLLHWGDWSTSVEQGERCVRNAPAALGRPPKYLTLAYIRKKYLYILMKKSFYSVFTAVHQ